jgi:hypothetical protein
MASITYTWTETNWIASLWSRASVSGFGGGFPTEYFGGFPFFDQFERDANSMPWDYWLMGGGMHPIIDWQTVILFVPVTTTFTHTETFNVPGAPTDGIGWLEGKARPGEDILRDRDVGIWYNTDPQAANSAGAGQGNGLTQEQIYQLLKDRIEFDPDPPGKGGARDAAFEEKVLRDLARILSTKTDSGIETLFARSIGNPNVKKLTVRYGKERAIRGGLDQDGRFVSLNSTEGLDYVNPEHRERRLSQGELATGSDASTVILAHELAHALSNVDEYGAVVVENEYRSAIGGFDPRSGYDGVPLDQLREKEKDIERWKEFVEAYGGTGP